MNKYQRSLMNKIDDITNMLASDWEARAYGCPLVMTRRQRAKAEQELKDLRAKLKASYR